MAMRSGLGYLMLILALLSGSVAAASFDCNKAKAAVERLICTNADLSRRDDAMAAEYARIAATALDKTELQRMQRTWLAERDACVDAGCVADQYERQSTVLKAYAQREQHAQARTYRLDQLGQGCPPLGGEPGPDSKYSSCKMTALRTLGRLGDKDWFAAEYCMAPRAITEARCDGGLFPMDMNDVTVLVLAQSPADQVVRLVLRHGSESAMAGETAHYRTDYGDMLEIPLYLAGTGHFNGSAYYLWQRDHWQPVDFKHWQRDLQKRLPKGLGVWKGPWPDLRKMHFESSLWRDSDANCCPTGGTVEAELGLDGTRLLIRALKIQRRPR